jgi:hypothetical protein
MCIFALLQISIALKFVSYRKNTCTLTISLHFKLQNCLVIIFVCMRIKYIRNKNHTKGFSDSIFKYTAKYSFRVTAVPLRYILE